MREIKFRAWHEETKKYLYFDLLDTDQDYHISSGEYVNIDYVEQFTGIFDKNGKEIYEGDILLDPRYEEPFRVEYRPNLAGYVGYGDDVACGCYDINVDGIEIIGNIHENPELFK